MPLRCCFDAAIIEIRYIAYFTLIIAAMMLLYYAFDIYAAFADAGCRFH